MRWSNYRSADSHNKFFINKWCVSQCPKIINVLKTKFSAGVDDFPEFLIKRCAQVIIDPLTHIINSLLTNGVFPNILKKSNIKPLFKKGEKQNSPVCTFMKPLCLLNKTCYQVAKFFKQTPRYTNTTPVTETTSTLLQHLLVYH